MASCCRCERSRESASSASSRSFSLKYLMTKTIATGNPNTARTLTMGMSAASISEDMAPVNVPDPGPFRAREKTKGPQAMTPAALRPLPRPQPLFVRSSGGRLVLERLAALLPPFAAALQPLAALLRALAGALLALAGALERLALLDLALLDQLLAPLFLGFALLLELLAALRLALATALHALAAALQPVRAIGARRRRRDEQRRDDPVARLHGPSLRVRVSARSEPSGIAAVKDLSRGDFVGGSAQMSPIVRPGQQREEPGALLGVAGEGKGRLGRQQVEVRAQRALCFHQRLRLVRERGARAGQLLDVAGEVAHGLQVLRNETRVGRDFWIHLGGIEDQPQRAQHVLRLAGRERLADAEPVRGAPAVRAARDPLHRFARRLRGGGCVGEQIGLFPGAAPRRHGGGGERLQVVLDLVGEPPRGFGVRGSQPAPRQLGSVRLRQVGDPARGLGIGQRIGAPLGGAVAVPAGAFEQVLARIGCGLPVTHRLAVGGRGRARLHRRFSRRAGHAALLAVVQRRNDAVLKGPRS